MSEQVKLVGIEPLVLWMNDGEDRSLPIEQAGDAIAAYESLRATLQRRTDALVKAKEAMEFFLKEADYLGFNEERRCHDCAYNALTHITTVLAEEGSWQPISTAPKDCSTAILLTSPDRIGLHRIWVGRWAWERWMSIPGDYGTHPTHWMPVPQPPKYDPYDP